jgi:8-oxo-dGTP pyrophosphatase MutT (NUDIX family)
MPAFTTNVEIGLWAHSGKVLLGAPPGAPKTSYLLYTAARLGIPVHTALDSLLRMAVGLCGAGAGRAGGERYIPVSIWVSPVFQSWYGSQRAAGHRLARARVVWQHPARAGQAPFLWALHPQIEVAGEGRAKTNEIVVGRPDISVVAALVPAAHLDDVRVLCVQEFRSPVRNPAGLVLELPSGSACRDDDPVSTALAELAKETGLVLPAGRLVPHGSRQLLPTLATYHAHLFSVVLEAAETARLERDQGVVRGVGADGERTQVMLVRLGDIVGGEQMDWAMLGMLQSVAGRAVRP